MKKSIISIAMITAALMLCGCSSAAGGENAETSQQTNAVTEQAVNEKKDNVVIIRVTAVDGNTVKGNEMGFGRGKGRGKGEMPADGNMPQPPEGMPEGEMPADGNMPQPPEGMPEGEMPADGNMPQPPERMPEDKMPVGNEIVLTLTDATDNQAGEIAVDDIIEAVTDENGNILSVKKADFSKRDENPGKNFSDAGSGFDIMTQ